MGFENSPTNKAMRNFRILFLLCLLANTLSACQSSSAYIPPPDWKYADLRALDPADDIPPSQDLIALYIRRVDEDIEIRLDYVDLSPIPDNDLIIKISTSSDIELASINIPASGDISALDGSGNPMPNLQPRITRDSFLDTIVVSINRRNLIQSGLPFVVSAYSTGTLASSINDQIGPVRSDAAPPPQADVLFSFWDTFPAATPAQALRMWDGAHNGPGRSRYGLSHLLNAGKSYQVPVFLLDLKSPSALSILDFMGVLPEIQSLADLRLVILPDDAQYDLSPDAFSTIPDSSSLNLPSTPFLYISNIPENLKRNYQVLFLPSQAFGKLHTPTSPYRWQGYTILRVPEDDETTASYQPTNDGPSLALRQALIQFATQPSEATYHPFYLGGQLANTSWGDPACVSPTMHYLTAHPWIHFLTPDNLVSLHPNQTATYEPEIGQPAINLRTKILTALQNAPSNAIADQAWQAYLSLLTPASPELIQLRAGYFGIVGHLLVAARWATRSGYATDCSVDVDWDGQAECILASPDFIATFEPSGGYIVTAFARRADGVHQIIAPYAQFVVGLGDPSTWDTTRGSEGDPTLVPGGFVDNSGPWTAQVSAGQITFTDTDHGISKTFRLTRTGLRVEYKSTSPLTVQISLGLDPWRRFFAGWGDAYREDTIPTGWEWSLEPGPRVSISTSGTLTSQAFNASRSYLAEPENPNFDYPAGHYIPFPLALVEINGQENFYIQMDVR
jgi:hypothetical protein